MNSRFGTSAGERSSVVSDDTRSTKVEETPSMPGSLAVSLNPVATNCTQWPIPNPLLDRDATVPCTSVAEDRSSASSKSMDALDIADPGQYPLFRG